jgi:hypothetical protein
MADDPNTTQNQDSEENSIPASPQEPTEQGTENTAHSEPSVASPEALESSPSDFLVKSSDIAPFDSTLTEAEGEPKTEEKPRENEPIPEPVFEPVQAVEPTTAQIPPNEPLVPESEPIKPEPISVIIPPKNSIRELLAKAKNAIQFRKRKKLDRVMTLFLKKSKITNDEVEKFLHISDATATRYLSQMEKENRIKQVGKTGHAVSYSRI